MSYLKVRKKLLIITFSCIIFFSSGCANNFSESEFENYQSEDIVSSNNFSSDEICLTKFETLFPVFVNGYFEYIDINGEVVTDYKFDKANYFNDGLAIVCKNQKYGAIDLYTNIVISIKYNKINDFHCGYACVSDENERYGFIDSLDRLIIPYRYTVANDFSEDIAIVSDDGYSYYAIDYTGTKIFEIECEYYSLIGNFHNGLQRQMYSFYNKTGECIIYDEIFRMDAWRYFPSDFSEGLAVYPIINDLEWGNNNDYDISYYMNQDNWIYKYIDVNGEVSIDNSFNYAEPFMNGLAIVEKNGERGVIDKTGEFIYMCDTIYGQYSEGYISYYEENEGVYKFGFRDKYGNIAIKPQYDEVLLGFTDGLALVKSGKMLMYIDKYGKIIYEFEEPQYKFWI